MSTPALFTVTDSAELNALLRALIEAKFRPAIPDTDISASPYIVAMMERVVSAQRDIDMASSNKLRVSNLDAWQRAESNSYLLAAVRTRLKECPENTWLRWSIDQRRKHVLDLLSPLRAEPFLIDELLNEMPTV